MYLFEYTSTHTYTYNPALLVNTFNMHVSR